VRQCERNNSADNKISEEGGGGGSPGTRAEISLQLVVKTMVRQTVPLQPREDPCQSRWMPEGDCDHMEGPH